MSQKTITKEPPLSPVHLESICTLIADTYEGLTGSEITKILGDCGLKDPSPELNKRYRLYNALADHQNAHQCSNGILSFISQAMNPARYFGKQDLFDYRLNELNKRLSLIGLQITTQAKYKKVNVAKTLNEAQERASHYKYKLELRNVHPEVIKYCNEELVKENYFHSVFEGVKSIAQRLRNLTGVHTDGNKLVDLIFSTTNPLLKINPLQTDTDRNEFIGLANITKGLFGMIRNPTAHTPKVLFVIDDYSIISA